MKQYIKSSDTSELVYKKSFRYPEYIYYQELDARGRVIYKYKQQYMHAEEPKKDYQEGMYYDVFEIMQPDSNIFEPISNDDRYYMFGLSELDVYPDDFVGYIWNGRLNHFGHLVGNKVVKDRGVTL